MKRLDLKIDVTFKRPWSLHMCNGEFGTKKRRVNSQTRYTY